jgi:putative FmdB family regulatory protein
MPTYTYRAVSPEQSCDHCVDSFDVRQSMSDPRLEQCEHCKHPIHRIIASVGYVRGIHFGDTMTPERFRAGGLRRLVKDDNGKYVDDTPK